MSKFNFGTKEKCVTCGKSVFSEEKVSFQDKIWHDKCFRCAKCNSKLSSTNYGNLNNLYYCKAHYLDALRNLKNTAEGEKTAFKPIENAPPAVNSKQQE